MYHLLPFLNFGVMDGALSEKGSVELILPSLLAISADSGHSKVGFRLLRVVEVNAIEFVLDLFYIWLLLSQYEG